MEANKIIVWTNPTAPFQKIYVIKEGQLVDQMGIRYDDIEDVLFALVNKYNLTQIDFSGSYSYGEKIMNNVINNQVIHFGKAKLEVTFIH